MIQLLLDAGADPNEKTDTGGTALMSAAMVGDAAAAEKLINAGAGATFKDRYGNTAERAACNDGEKGHQEVCHLIRRTLEKK